MFGIEYLQKFSRQLAIAARCFIWLYILGFAAYRVVLTKDAFFKGFGNERIHHGPNFSALKFADKISKLNVTKEVFFKQRHLNGVCKFPKIWVNWYGAFDNMFWDLAHSHSDCSSENINTDWVRNSVKD